MKTCLISPPTVTDFEDPSVAESEAIRLIAEHAPIGVLTLASILDGRGEEPDVVDLNRWYYEYLRSTERDEEGLGFCDFAVHRLESFSSDVFGFSTICSSYPLTLRMAQQLKQLKPDAIIILGGPQASVVDVATLREFACVDYIVRGEAEVTLPSVLDALEAGSPLQAIPGVTFREGDEVIRNENAPVISDLDAVPTPAFHLYPHIKECRYIPLELGRGCPFACEFCSTNDFFRRQFRLKSPERVINEMRKIKQEYKISTFDLVHDMFTVDRKRVVQFCEALLASGETFHWNCSARTDCVDDELIAMMAKAGCKGIFFGIETGSARLQKIVKKRIDLSEATHRIECTDRHGITTAVSLITGFPEETMEDLRDTVAFMLDALRLDHAAPQLHLLAPLAETPIHSRYRDQLVLDDIYSDMSYQGWRQSHADREMIEQHPDIFPNFYAVPTPGLDRKYLKELRDFVLNGMQRFRWVLVALHQQTGDVLPVFEAWRAWRRDRHAQEPQQDADLSTYYAALKFRSDFLRFLAEHFLPSRDDDLFAVAAMVQFEMAFGEVVPDAGDEPHNSFPSRVLELTEALDLEVVPRVSASVRLAELETDYNGLILCLKEKGDPAEVPRKSSLMAERRVSDDRTEFIQVSHLSAQLLQLCDGVRTVREIGEAFGKLDPELGGIAPDKACFFGLELLRQQGVIVAAQLVDA